MTDVLTGGLGSSRSAGGVVAQDVRGLCGGRRVAEGGGGLPGSVREPPAAAARPRSPRKTPRKQRLVNWQ